MKNNNYRGSILIMSMVFMIAMALFAVIFLNRVIYVNKNTGYQTDKVRAFYIAEAGASKAMWYLLNTAPDGSTDGSWRTCSYTSETCESTSGPINENLAEGSYTTWVEDSKEGIRITSKGTCNGFSRTVQQTVTLSVAEGSNDAIAWWKLDDKEGENAADSSENKNDGTLVDGPKWTDGPRDGALYFNGKTSYVEVKDSDSLDITDTFTLALWFKSLDLDWPKQFLLNKFLNEKDGTVYGIMWDITDNLIQFSYGGEGIGYPESNTDISISDKEWHHIVYTYDGKVFSGYLDGKEAISPVEIGFSLKVSEYALILGSGQRDSFYFYGNLDDVRIYNRALSAEEVENIYKDTEGNRLLTPVANSWAEI